MKFRLCLIALLLGISSISSGQRSDNIAKVIKTKYNLASIPAFAGSSDFNYLSGQAAGLSNFRTSLVAPTITPPSHVPVPAAAWLFGSGLAGLIASVRRKSKAAI